MKYLLALFLFLSFEAFSANPDPVYSCQNGGFLFDGACQVKLDCENDSSIPKTCKYDSTNYKWPHVKDPNMDTTYVSPVWAGQFVYNSAYSTEHYYKGNSLKSAHSQVDTYNICHCTKPEVSVEPYGYCPDGYLYDEVSKSCQTKSAPINPEYTCPLPEDGSTVEVDGSLCVTKTYTEEAILYYDCPIYFSYRESTGLCHHQWTGISNETKQPTGSRLGCSQLYNEVFDGECHYVERESAVLSCPANHELQGFTCVQLNFPPVANNITASTNEDVLKSIHSNFTDSDSGDTHSITDLTQPENGTVVVSGTNFMFTPDPDWFGTTTFTYRIKDNKDAKSNVVTVTLNVNPVNDAPSVTAVTFNLNEDGSQTLTPNILDVDE